MPNFPWSTFFPIFLPFLANFLRHCRFFSGSHRHRKLKISENSIIQQVLFSQEMKLTCAQNKFISMDPYQGPQSSPPSLASTSQPGPLLVFHSWYNVPIVSHALYNLYKWVSFLFRINLGLHNQFERWLLPNMGLRLVGKLSKQEFVVFSSSELANCLFHMKIRSHAAKFRSTKPETVRLRMFSWRTLFFCLNMA